MGQKVNPISNRLGIIKGWDSNWFGGKDYSGKIVEDYKIRKYLMARLHKASVSKIIIERTLKLITVTINSSRPGIIIGKGGQEVDKLREELKKITKKDVQINIFEIKRPELDADQSLMLNWLQIALPSKSKEEFLSEELQKWL
jgi:small subunit ribosomal protein S3